MTWQPHWQWWQDEVEPPAPPPETDSEPSVWEVTKAANRLARKIDRVESGALMPKPWYAQDAAEQLASAKRLLSDVRQVIASRSPSRGGG